MIKQLFHLTLSACAVLILAAACQAIALEEEIVLPAQPEEPVVSGRATIPYSITVQTETTRVSYEDGQYAFKTGDKLHVVGVARTDLEGYLTQNGDVWSGDLTYDQTKGVPGDDTELSITLVHADNSDESTYSTAIVGSAPTGSTLLREAVEKYSLFTAANMDGDNEVAVKLSDPSAFLLQRAAFLDVKVEFDFDGSHIIDAGKALVDLKIGGKELTEETHFHELPGTNGEDFYVTFVVVVPGGKKTDEFTITVGDRSISFSTVTQLGRNKKYTVNRQIAFHPQLGDPFWSDGTYGRLRHPDSEERIVGIVVYVNHHYENPDNDPEIAKKIAIDDAITEKDAGYGHGLVMALTNAGVDKKWCESGGKTIQCTGGFLTQPEHTLESSHLSGYTNTQSIISALDGAGVASGSAAMLAKNYQYNGISVSEGSTTGWFLPSIGQWMYTISTDGFGGADPAKDWVNGNGVSWLIYGYGDASGNLGDLVLVKKCETTPPVNELVEFLNNRLEQFHNEFEVTYDPFGDPSATNNISDNYWTSSEYSKNKALRMNLGSVRQKGSDYYSTIKVKAEEKDVITVYAQDKVNYNMKVRPFLAF